MNSHRFLNLPRFLPTLIPTLFPSNSKAQILNISADTPSSPTSPTPSTPVESPTITTPTPLPSSTTTTTTSSTPLSTSTPPASTSLPATSSLPISTTSTTPTSQSITSSLASSTQSIQPHSSSIIYLTITATGSDGSIYTSVSSTASAVPVQTGLSSSGGGGGGSSSGGTWAIIGGVVGGLAALAAVIFIVFRCTQRRFSELDDEDVAIKWPELVNRADDSSTLNPLAARQAAGHGIGDDGDDEKPSVSPHQGLYSDHSYAPDLSRGNTVQSAMFSNGSYQGGPGGYGERQAYYPDDPYLGTSSAPQPFPPSIPYDQQQHPAYPPIGPPAPYSTANRTASPGPGQEADPYQMSWGGAEAIPLTVVGNGNGSSGPRRRTPSPP